MPCDHSLEEKFLQKNIPEPNSGCWLWFGTRHKYGYGYMKIDGKKIYAHRISYEIYKGEIPAGLQLDHICRTPSCVNPDHLEAVTQQINLSRGFSPPAINARKTHCHKGHIFDNKNPSLDKNGWRICKICRENNWKEFYKKNRDKINIRKKLYRLKKKSSQC